MPRYRYKLLDAQEKTRGGTVEAPSREAALQSLSKDGCVVTELEPLVAGFALPPVVRRFLPAMVAGVVLILVGSLVIPGLVAGRRVKLQRQQTQLLALMKTGDVDQLTRSLEERGYDLNHPMQDGTYMLHLAVKSERPEVVDLFLSSGAEVQVKDGHDSTPLHLAALLPKADICELLLAAGAEPAAQDQGGDTPMHLACEWGREAQVKLLLENGAPTHLQNAGGETVVHAALESGVPEVLRVLLDGGAEVNTPDDQKQTALHRAVAYGDREAAVLLLERGADRRLRDQEGKRAADLTEEAELKQLVTPK